MTTTLAGLASRPVLASLAGLGIAIGLAAGPLTALVETADRIAAGREALAWARAATSRPPLPSPLSGADADTLLAAFRTRLDRLAAERAAVIDRAELEPDPARPTLPRLRAALRGTAEGLHDLLHALETQAPLVAVEEAEIGVERQADPDLARPTVMRLALSVRGVLVPAEPEPRGSAAGSGPGMAPGAMP